MQDKMQHRFKVGDIVEVQISFVAKLERSSYNMPSKPVVFGKIKEVWKTKRPLGIDLYGLKAKKTYLRFKKGSRIPPQDYFIEDNIEHQGLFWFKPEEVKLVSGERMKKIKEKMLLHDL